MLARGSFPCTAETVTSSNQHVSENHIDQTKCPGADLEYEAAHPGAGRQHEEHVGKEHEVPLALLLTDRKSEYSGVIQHQH